MCPPQPSFLLCLQVSANLHNAALVHVSPVSLYVCPRRSAYLLEFDSGDIKDSGCEINVEFRSCFTSI
jgi:hypothetical protein